MEITMRRSILTVLFATVASVLAACQPAEAPKPPTTPITNQSPATPAGTGTPATSPSVDPKAPAAPSAKLSTLEGAWPGSGGTELKITKAGDKYKVEITGADKKAESFDGIAKGDVIEFTRKGKAETIKAASPEETGMKWSEGEKACVVITKGSESYCRK